jgi:hypothetical protein
MFKQCQRCLFDSDIAEIGEAQCNYCDLHDTLEKQANPLQLYPILDKIRNREGQYNCLIGISGGLDSSTLLYAAVKKWNLKPLVIHFDNGWNNKAASSNIEKLITKLGVNAIIYKVDKHEYDRLNDAFLAAGVPDADIPNDIAMTKLMYQTAERYGIKYILNGHDFRTEGSTPAKWTYMDARYIQSVYLAYTGKKLLNYPLFTFVDQIKYALKGIEQVRPFHFGFDRKKIEIEMIRECDWNSYGAKHCENIYTEFVGSYLLPGKFGIDKRRVYLSARVRSGEITKDEARQIKKLSTPFDFDKLGKDSDRILELIKSHKTDRTRFDHYNFKKWRPLIWLLAKLKVVPFTFYKKYCF